MIYEVRCRVFFPNLAKATVLINKIRSEMDDAIVVHPDEPEQQGSTLELIKCFHDQTPTEPCISCGEIHCP